MTEALDHTRPLVASGNLRRRRLVNRLAESAATGSALVAVAVLGLVVYSVASRGAPVMSLDFLTQNPPAIEGQGAFGGIAPALVGTGILMLGATAIAMPVGILIALYLTEFASAQSARAIRLVLDLLNGLPTIVIGIFVFGLLVAGHGQRGSYGSFALAIVMLPLIARSSQEMLLTVPHSLREAADALGVSRWRSVRGVILPSAFGGIVTGTILAIARAAGETAPLIFTTAIFAPQVTSDLFGQAMPNIPVYIFQASEANDPTGWARAWGAALALMMFIFLASTVARLVLRRSRKKLTG